MKFIKKLIIQNFQSHENTVLELQTDLNVIVGQSDKGKSAILRAIKWVLYNEPRGSDFIRYGTNECSVTLVMGDGYTVTRTRKKNKNIYTIIKPDDQKLEFENFGNDVPNEVIEATGVKRIKLDTDIETKLNLNEQLDPPFLLAETGTIRAKAIGRIVNTNILDAAERDILKDISNNNITIKSIERQLEEIEQDLTGYSNIEEQGNNIKTLEELLEKVTFSNDKLEKLEFFKDKLNQIDINMNENKSTIEKLKFIPTLSDYYNSLKDSFSLSDRLCTYSLKLKNINSNISSDNEILQKLINLEQINISTKAIEEKVATCTKISDLNVKLNEIDNGIKKGQEYMNSLKKELINKVEVYSKTLKQLGKCPTCYSTISDTVVNQIINEMEGDKHGCN